MNTTSYIISKQTPDANSGNKTNPACKCGVQSRSHAGINPALTGRARTRRLRTGFTLIELLVVISIIILLVGILLPVIIKAKALGYLAATRAYITTLETGALRYQQEKQYFPGQENTNLLNPSIPRHLTGSQLLVTESMGINYDQETGKFQDIDEIPPSSEYVEYNADRVIHTDKGPENPNDYPMFTIIDLPPLKEARPILYYPARLGNTRTISTSFVLDDNSDLTNMGDQTRYNFYGILWDNRFNTSSNVTTDEKTTWGTPVPNPNACQAYNADTFLIFGKGVDDRDENWGWFTPKSARNF